jgi:hypothetical protein
LPQGGLPKNEQLLGQQQDSKKILTKLLLSVPKNRLFSMSLKSSCFYLFGTIALGTDQPWKTNVRICAGESFTVTVSL